VVREFGRPPAVEDFAPPSPSGDETVVSVTASAISRLTLGRASGAHYSAETPLPFVAGTDGVGTTPDGRRVFFLFPRSPYGSLAELAPVRREFTTPVPDGLVDAAAAAAANPGMSCWVPLSRRARVPPGESVLVNGATGNAGRMAVQVAKHLGARYVIATGRDPEKLRTLAALGADRTLTIGDAGNDYRDSVRAAVAECKVGVVLDYLWGPSARAVLLAIGGPHPPRGTDPVRFVQIGTISAPEISLAPEGLRSSGLEILGSGLGSVPPLELVHGIGDFLAAMAKAHFRVEYELLPLSGIESTWPSDAEHRIVYAVR